TSAAAPASRNVGGDGACAGGDRRPGRQRRPGKSVERFPFLALSAAQALDEALGIESGDWLVVNGAGGVTGGLLVQLAAARGAPVVASASAKKDERIRGHGASEVLDYHGDWPALVREITVGGAPRAVNAARGQAGALPVTASRPRPQGSFASTGPGDASE